MKRTVYRLDADNNNCFLAVAVCCRIMPLRIAPPTPWASPGGVNHVIEASLRLRS
jgi:hypothetical protein